MRRGWILKGEMWSRWTAAGFGGLLAVTLPGTIPAQAAVIRSGTVYCSAGQQLIISLSVESLLREPSAHYAREYAARLRLLSVTRDIATVKSRLQRTNPLEHQAEYNRMFAQLLDLESRRRDLQAEAVGEE